MTPQEILTLPVPDCDAGSGLTVRSYLLALLLLVWQEGEGFSGKRPWGNSGWDSDLALALVLGGAMEGVVDLEGPWLDNCDYAEVNRLIAAAIGAL